MSAPVIPGPGVASIQVLRVALARRILAEPSSPAVEPLADALASILGDRFAGDLSRCAAALVAARAALAPVDRWQVDELDTLAARSAEEASDWSSDSAGRAKSTARTMATGAYMERVEREDPCAWAVLEARPIKSAILAMARVVSR